MVSRVGTWQAVHPIASKRSRPARPAVSSARGAGGAKKRAKATRSARSCSPSSGSATPSLSLVGAPGSAETCCGSSGALGEGRGLVVMPIWFCRGPRTKRSIVAVCAFTPKRPMVPRSRLKRPLIPSPFASSGSESATNTLSGTNSKRPTPNMGRALRCAICTGWPPGPVAGMGWRRPSRLNTAKGCGVLVPKEGTMGEICAPRSTWPVGVLGSPKRPRWKLR